MKLNVFDIPEEGLDLVVQASEATPPKDVWFENLVKETFPENFPKKGRALLDIHIVRTNDNVQVSGAADIGLKPSCDRCLEVFDKHLSVPVQVNLAPHKAMDFAEGEGEEEEGLDADDVAFSFYKGDEINFADIIREILVLEAPLRYLCSEECKGLCPHCGQNLNLAACACSKSAVDPRFAALKQLLKT